MCVAWWGAGGVVYWWDGFNGNPVQILPPGIYTVMVTAMNNCTATQTVEVTAPPALAFESISTTVDCDGNFTPNITVSAITPESRAKILDDVASELAQALGRANNSAMDASY